LKKKSRPLSPHLSIYRPQITSMLSILHRITGLFLSLGLVIFAFTLVFLARGPETYIFIDNFYRSWLGSLFLLGYIFAFFYHLSNGIRHLFWDIGVGFEIKNAAITGWLVIVFSFIMTCLFWISLKF
tara:strand:+ start:761 stop:1141 length:381 start_codon:yes stop_codon:yes gene_type:complete